MALMPQIPLDWITAASAGLALFVVNYWLWKVLVAWFIRRQGRSERRMLVLFFFKIGVNFAAVALAITVLDLNPVAFLAGLTVGVFGLIIKGLLIR